MLVSSGNSTYEVRLRRLKLAMVKKRSCGSISEEAKINKIDTCSIEDTYVFGTTSGLVFFHRKGLEAEKIYLQSVNV